MGGGGQSFCNTNGTLCSSLDQQDYYEIYKNLGYTIVKSKAELEAYNGKGPVLGIFARGHMDTWIDRELYPENLKLSKSHPDGTGESALHQPGLELMTMKAVCLSLLVIF